MAFQKAVKQVAFAKIGAFGPTGSGKTTLATMLALYLSKTYCKGAPVAFVDTEKGTDFVQPYFDAEGVELFVNKTRAGKDLQTAHAEALKLGACCVIADSMTHFWQDILASLKKAKNTNRLDIEMIGQAKEQWWRFTDAFVTSPIHYIMAGRQGNEWDNVDVEDDSGKIKRELLKGGTKMKAEGDTGYETDLLLELSSMDDPNAPDYKKLKTKKLVLQPSRQMHLAMVKKCRVRVLNGKLFSWHDTDAYKPGDYKLVGDCFKPYFDFLNIGGEHVAFDTSRNSEELFTGTGKNEFFAKKKRKEIAVEEIKGALGCVWTAAVGKDATAKSEIINALFGTHSWTHVENLDPDTLEVGANICIKMKALAISKMPANRDEVLQLVEQAKIELQDESMHPVPTPAIGDDDLPF